MSELRTEEYKSLRQEILQWQRIRVIALGLALTLVSGLLGSSVAAGYPWQLQGALVNLILATLAHLCWFAGQGNASIGSYLLVFHEEGGAHWEGAVRTRGLLGSEGPNINAIVGHAAILAAIVGNLAPVMRADSGAEELAGLGRSAAGVVYLLSLIFVAYRIYVLMFRSYPRNERVQLWQRVQKEMTAAHGAETGAD